MPRQGRSLANLLRRLSTSVSKEPNLPTPSVEQTAPPLQVREHFSLPTRVPSWFVGHMYRAMRSLPSLLERKPPPLIIEVRDARLPFSSINVAFEQLLERMDDRDPKNSKRKEPSNSSVHDTQAWRNRRLIVYNKADLIDQRLIDPIVSAFATLQNQEVMFVNSSKDRDVGRVIKWVKAWASKVAESEDFMAMQREQAIRTAAKSRKKKEELASRRRPASHLLGAFRQTTTPEDGVRLVILGMPNVGKSSLLNALRRVGTGKGKAASTAPEPGHTRKLTGTVRITPQKKKLLTASDPVFQLDNPDVRENSKPSGPDIYVYDTPGVMVPFLGHGEKGAETAMKLMVTAGMKTMWFDKVALADYLLYRMNRRWAWAWTRWNNVQGRRGAEPRPAYLEHLPLPDYLKPTNEIDSLLEELALKAPGTLTKGGIRDLEGAASFMIGQWRDGKLGVGELDLASFEDPSSLLSTRSEDSPKLDTKGELFIRTKESFARYFDEAKQSELSGVGTSARPARGADRASRRTMEKKDTKSLQTFKKEEIEGNQDPLLSKNQAKRRERAVGLAVRNSRLREKGVRVKAVFGKQPKATGSSRKTFLPSRRGKAKGSSKRKR